MESGNILHNLHTGEGEEKKKTTVIVLTWGRSSRFCFRVPHFHDSSEFLLMPALFHASSGAENK